MYLNRREKGMFPSSPEEMVHGVIGASGGDGCARATTAAAKTPLGPTADRLLTAFHIR